MPKKATKKPAKKTAAAKKPTKKTTRKPRKVAVVPVKDIVVRPVVDASGVVMIVPVQPDVVNS